MTTQLLHKHPPINPVPELESLNFQNNGPTSEQPPIEPQLNLKLDSLNKTTGKWDFLNF